MDFCKDKIVRDNFEAVWEKACVGMLEDKIKFVMYSNFLIDMPSENIDNIIKAYLKECEERESNFYSTLKILIENTLNETEHNAEIRRQACNKICGYYVNLLNC